MPAGFTAQQAIAFNHSSLDEGVPAPFHGFCSCVASRTPRSENDGHSALATTVPAASAATARTPLVPTSMPMTTVAASVAIAMHLFTLSQLYSHCPRKAVPMSAPRSGNRGVGFGRPADPCNPRRPSGSSNFKKVEGLPAVRWRVSQEAQGARREALPYSRKTARKQFSRQTLRRSLGDFES